MVICRTNIEFVFMILISSLPIFFRVGKKWDLGCHFGHLFLVTGVTFRASPRLPRNTPLLQAQPLIAARMFREIQIRTWLTLQPAKKGRVENPSFLKKLSKPLFFPRTRGFFALGTVLSGALHWLRFDPARLRIH